MENGKVFFKSFAPPLDTAILDKYGFIFIKEVDITNGTLYLRGNNVRHHFLYLRKEGIKVTQYKIFYFWLILLSIQNKKQFLNTLHIQKKKKCTVGCTIMTLIYSSEVSTNLPN